MPEKTKEINQALFTGRTVIYSDAEKITRNNILTVLHTVLPIHENNSYQINYLYEYYRGNQPILRRTKDIREEINNKVVENRANEIVSFKTGYLIGQPIQYVTRGNDDSSNNDLEALNGFMFLENKSSKDKKLVDWMHICGTSYRMVLPNPNDYIESEDSPFKIYRLDPRNTFIVYRNDLSQEPLMGVKYIVKDNGDVVYSIYTNYKYFEITNDKITKEELHSLGAIPIIEYPLNEARLGAFEIVLTMLDAINTVDSNRIDGVEQFIQSLLVFKGVDIDDDSYKNLKKDGGIKIPNDADVKYLIQELNQSETQTLKKDMYDTILTICGMPNRNGGSSTSDTGSAVIMRDGWSSAEARAQDTEEMFKESEREFLKIVVNIVNTLRNKNLKLKDIDIRFTRRNYENIQGKAQVLTTLLANDKIDPKLAFEHSGMFTDPTLAYMQSMAHYEQIQEEQAKALKTAVTSNKGHTEGEDE